MSSHNKASSARLTVHFFTDTTKKTLVCSIVNTQMGVFFNQKWGGQKFRTRFYPVHSHTDTSSYAADSYVARVDIIMESEGILSTEISDSQ